MSKSASLRRIQADIRELTLDPSDRYHAAPLENDMFEWHFTIRGADETDFQNGIYHGRILLPPDYPFKPPHIIFLTPSGRFEINTKICLSFSAYHPELWQPAWGIRLILEALISFLPTPADGAIGAIDWSSTERKKLAMKSQTYCCPICGPIKDIVPKLKTNNTNNNKTKTTTTFQKEIAELQRLQTISHAKSDIVDDMIPTEIDDNDNNTNGGGKKEYDNDSTNKNNNYEDNSIATNEYKNESVTTATTTNDHASSNIIPTKDTTNSDNSNNNNKVESHVTLDKDIVHVDDKDNKEKMLLLDSPNDTKEGKENDDMNEEIIIKNKGIISKTTQGTTRWQDDNNNDDDNNNIIDKQNELRQRKQILSSASSQPQQATETSIKENVHELNQQHSGAAAGAADTVTVNDNENNIINNNNNNIIGRRQIIGNNNVVPEIRRNANNNNNNNDNDNDNLITKFLDPALQVIILLLSIVCYLLLRKIQALVADIRALD